MKKAFAAVLAVFAIHAALLFPADADARARAASRPPRPSPSLVAPQSSLRSARIPLYPGRPSDKRAGRLVYRGGLELSSSDKRFGGWSDLAVSIDGSEILSISDEAHWMRARLTYDADGDLAGASLIRIVDMRDRQGKIMRGKQGDAEGLMLERPHDLYGPVAVSFEGDVRVWRYDLSKGLNAKPTPVPIGDWAKKLNQNQQIEAIARLNADTFIAFGESPVQEGDDILAALETYPGKGRRGLANSRPLSVIPHDPFSITSAARAPDGHGIYILERRFSIVGGLGMEMRYIRADDIRPGARLDGEVLANLSFQDANIDNMEGLAIREGAKGETFFYIISDDNYSPLERTLLLMFELKR